MRHFFNPNFHSNPTRLVLSNYYFHKLKNDLLDSQTSYVIHGTMQTCLSKNYST